MAFRERLDEVIDASNSLLCLGLDPSRDGGVAAAEAECMRLLDTCLPMVCAVKPNLAFFEQFGPAGLEVLQRIRERVPRDRILLLDAKRGDIGSTAAAYAHALFTVFGADAVTVNPLMGADSVAPFLKYDGRGVFLLARTSNSGATDFLEQRLAGGEPLYAHIVKTASGWPGGENIGFVVGATVPGAVAEVRGWAPDAPLLTPGVGAQGGDLAATVGAGLASHGGRLLVPLSRGLSQAADPAAAARELRDTINQIRQTHTGVAS